MNPASASGQTCARCGAPVSASGAPANGPLYCASCRIVVDAVQYVADREQEPEVQASRLNHIKPYLKIFVIVLGFGITLALLPGLIRAFRPPKPIRTGTYDTDKATDKCIANLWTISSLLQENRLPGSDVVCPASKQPYEFKTVNGVMEAHCPKPDQHAMQDISVTKNGRIPEVHMP